MDALTIQRLCKEKEDSLFRKYFGGIYPYVANVKPQKLEVLGKYDKLLPIRIEEEFYEYLKTLWKEYAPNDPRTIDELLDKRALSYAMTEDNHEGVNITYEEAIKRNLWERITKTNDDDIYQYVCELEDYTRDLLLCMRCDFLEEITK